MGAGEEAGAILGWFGDRLGQVADAARWLGQVLWQLGRIVTLAFAAVTLGPLAALIRFFSDPGRWIDAGRDAIMGLVSPFRDQLPRLLLLAIPGVGWVLAATGWTPSDMRDRGLALVEGFASGIVPDPVVDAVSGVAEEARSLLPFSDAETGPFSNLTEMGGSVVQTLAGGVEGEGGTLAASLGGVLEATPLGQAAQGIAGGLGLDGGSGGGGGASGLGGDVHFHMGDVNIENVEGSEEAGNAVARRVEERGLEALSELERKLLSDMGQL